MPRQEALKPEIPILHFAPEGYVSGSDPEFLDGFIQALKSAGFDPQQLVFSGFDGTQLAQGEPMPRHEAIFVMNESGWRQALKYKETNPAQYAEGWETPCIGLYDKNQLVHVYSHGFKDTPPDDRAMLTDIKFGAPLDQIRPGEPVEEAIVHKAYPDASPTDALVGVVFLDEPTIDDSPGFDL